MAGELPGEMRIGEVLQDARQRAGLDIRAAEERTKIRAKYLRALEDEDWESLPSSAYAKGFLRSYAQLLGLDGEALVDEYRRQVESGRDGSAYPLGDQVLETRRRPGGRESATRLWPALAIAVVAVLALLLVIGLSGDDDDSEGERRQAQGQGRGRDGAGRDGPKRERAEGTVTLAISVREPVEVCLLGGGKEALIDGQVLAAGTEEVYERRRFELRFPKGFDGDQFKLELAGKQRRLPKADGPAAYEIVAPQRVRTAPEPGEECP